MLLSLYASFRWAGTDHYVLKIASLIILASFFSAYVGVAIGSFLFGPLPLLSFPFYAIQDEMHGAPIPPEGYSFWIQTYRIHFLTAEISNLKANDSAGMGTYQLFGYHIAFLNTEIGYIDTQGFNRYWYTFPLLFFVLVNVVGAMLGYGISKLHIFQKSEWYWTGPIVRIAMGIIIIGVGVLLHNFGVVTTVRVPPWTGGYYTITLYPYDSDGVVFVIFGITWAGIAIAELVNRYL